MYAGDLLPLLVLDVAEDGRAFDFTGWTSLVATVSGPVTVSGSAVGDSRGTLTYTWTSGQTAAPGDYAVFVRGVSPAPASKQRTFEATGVLSIVLP
jgi:hypothetical protein